MTTDILKPASDDAPEYYNDAELLGNETPAYVALLSEPATFLIGEMWGAKDRRNTQDGKWKPVTATWRDWISGTGEVIDSKSRAVKSAAWGFSRHPIGQHKEGPCIVLGSSIGRARKAKAMETMYAIGIDIDSGVTLAEVLDKVEASGLFCVVYTTFSHGKEGLKLKHDEVIRKLKIKPADLNLEAVKNYLRNHKNRYEDNFIDSVQIVHEKRQEKDGVVIELKPPPLEKMRLVFPLAAPVKIIDLAETQGEALAVWESKITGLAAKLLGVPFDTSCTDPSRLFFTARHPKDAADWYCAIVRGDPIKFEDVPTADKAAYVNNRTPNSFEVASGAHHHAPACYTPSGRSLNDWHRQAKDRFSMADLVEDLCSDRIRVAGGEAQGHVHIECPFEHEHSSEGGTATMVVNAIDSPTDYWTWYCHHDACQGRHKLEFLAEALRQDWFPESELFGDSVYMLAGDDEPEEPPAVDESRFEPINDWLPSRYKIRGGTIYGPGSDDDDMPLCQAFNVVGRASNLAGSAGAGRIIAFENENGVEVELTLSMAELNRDGGGDVISALSDAGMRLYMTGTKSKTAILNLLRQIEPQRHIPTVPRPGWVQDNGGVVVGYLCPTGEYIPAGGGMPYRLATAATAKDRTAAGTLEGWQDAANAAMAPIGDLPPNFFWVSTLAAAFAGPLLGLVGQSSCGFNLSGESSRGKTLALKLGSAAWATPKEKRGVLYSLNATTNAMEDLATIGTESFLALDEIGAMANPKELPAILFGLSTGSGKSRKAGRGAGLAEDAEFRTFAVLTNEHPLRAVVTDAGGDYKTGLSVRFADLDVTGGARVSAETLARMEKAFSNYGHAGPAFVRWLVAEGWHKRTNDLKARIADTASELAKDGTPAQVRAAQVFGIAQVAGELACDAGILAGKDVIRAAVATAWETFRDSAEGKATEGEASQLDSFRAWIVRNLDSRIVSVGDDAPRFRDLAGWYDHSQIVIIADALNVREMGLNGTAAGLLKALNEIGALVRSGKNNAHNKLPGECGGGAVRNYRIDRAKLGLPAAPPNAYARAA